MTIVAATPRLLLRRWEADDAALTDGIYDDAETMRWFGDGRTFTREQVAKAIAGIIVDYAAHGYGNYAVVERESNTVIGHCGAHHVAGRDWVELDFALGKRWWGRGYATEAVAAVFLRCFVTDGVGEIVCVPHPDNTGAIAVLRKLGMRPRGELYSHGMQCVLYAIHKKGFVLAPDMRSSIELVGAES
jgi:RimJ/RimL family protein N-acetyltransferase